MAQLRCEQCGIRMEDLDPTAVTDAQLERVFARHVLADHARLPRLTPHQQETFNDIERTCRRHRTETVEGAEIGRWSAVVHLQEKGYVVKEPYRGPRGGEHYRIRPLTTTAHLAVRP